MLGNKQTTTRRSTDLVSVEEYKELNRTMWAFGDYRPVADLLRPGAEALVEELGVGQGDHLLDVATGSGNVAVAAAERGARVVGIDLTPEYLALARERVRRFGDAVKLKVGDAEALEVEDGAFDYVTSTFGAQFAPRHELVAQEMARACRPGGVVAMCNWTPSSWTAEFQALLASYFPPPPSYVGDAMQWGDAEYVAGLFGPGFAFSASTRTLNYEFSTAEELVAFMEDSFGPAVIARHRLRDRWAEARRALVEMTRRFAAPDAGFIIEYLVVKGAKERS